MNFLLLLISEKKHGLSSSFSGLFLNFDMDQRLFLNSIRGFLSCIVKVCWHSVTSYLVIVIKHCGHQ